MRPRRTGDVTLLASLERTLASNTVPTLKPRSFITLFQYQEEGAICLVVRLLNPSIVSSRNGDLPRTWLTDSGQPSIAQSRRNLPLKPWPRSPGTDRSALKPSRYPSNTLRSRPATADSFVERRESGRARCSSCAQWRQKATQHQHRLRMPCPTDSRSHPKKTQRMPRQFAGPRDFIPHQPPSVPIDRSARRPANRKRDTQGHGTFDISSEPPNRIAASQPASRSPSPVSFAMSASVRSQDDGPARPANRHRRVNDADRKRAARA